MNQILMLFAFPIGLIFFFADKRQQKTNHQIAENFISEVRANPTLSDGEKIGHIKKMFLINRYKVEKESETSLVVSYKHLNLGAAILSFALVPFYVGVLFFILWFLFIKKPENWEITLSPEDTPHTASLPA